MLQSGIKINNDAVNALVGSGTCNQLVAACSCVTPFILMPASSVLAASSACQLIVTVRFMALEQNVRTALWREHAPHRFRDDSHPQ